VIKGVPVLSIVGARLIVSTDNISCRPEPISRVTNSVAFEYDARVSIGRSCMNAARWVRVSCNASTVLGFGRPGTGKWVVRFGSP